MKLYELLFATAQTVFLNHASGYRLVPSPHSWRQRWPIESSRRALHMCSGGDEQSFNKLFRICRDLAAPKDFRKTTTNKLLSISRNRAVPDDSEQTSERTRNFVSAWETKRARVFAESADGLAPPLRNSTGEEAVRDCVGLVRIKVATSVTLDDSGVQVISVTGSSPDNDTRIINILAILSEVRIYIVLAFLGLMKCFCIECSGLNSVSAIS
jgi:hypothetical protein